MVDKVVFDIRALQTDSRSYSPVGRAMLSLVKQSGSVLGERAVLFSDRQTALPETLSNCGGELVHTVPFRRETVTFVTTKQWEGRLVESLRPQVRPYVRLLNLVECAPGDGEGRAFPGFSLVQGWGLPDPGKLVATVPAMKGGAGHLDRLDRVDADLLFGDGQAFIAVDGAVAHNKDVMRGLLSIARTDRLHLIVLGDGAAVHAPEIKILRVSPALLGEIVRKAIAVLVPDKGNAEAVAAAEVELMGGRCLTVGDRLPIHGLNDLRVLPPGKGAGEESVDFGAFWDQALAALPPATLPRIIDRPRIALVTPMFPDKGGPPHSSLDLAMALTEIADLDIWTESDMLPAHRAKVQRVFRLSAGLNPENYDEIVYVLGNHPMYSRIFDLMQEHGGVLIQHDAHMIDFLNCRFGKEGLSSILQEEYGQPVDVNDVSRLIGNLADYGRPFLQEVVRHANPVIVHSPTAARLLRDLYGVQAEYFPVAMPYSFKQPELTEEARIRAKMMAGISPSRPCIISFGEVHLMKGALQCLFAMKDLCDWGIDFQFLFVGPVDDGLRDELEKRIKDYGLRDHVKLVGGVSEAEYIQYLQAGDIVLQIRQIPFGQVSGALLDAVSAGMHGVASENLAISIEAPAMIRRVSDKASPTIYAEKLAEMIESGVYLQRPGPGWEDFTVKHDFARYSRNLLNLVFGSASRN